MKSKLILFSTLFIFISFSSKSYSDDYDFVPSFSAGAIFCNEFKDSLWSNRNGYFLGISQEYPITLDKVINILLDVEINYSNYIFEDLSVGFRFGNAYKYPGYLDIMTGMMFHNYEHESRGSLGIKSKIDLGFCYKSFSLEIGFEKYILTNYEMNNYKISINYSFVHQNRNESIFP